MFSRRLRWSLAGAAAAVLALAVASWITTGDDPRHAAYVTVLDLLAMNDPAVGERDGRQILQLLARVMGLLSLPVMVAAALEALGTFRTALSCATRRVDWPATSSSSDWAKSVPTSWPDCANSTSPSSASNGAGIAGLALAQRLDTLGWEVVVLEKAPG
ncbi:hypothetical protein [Streptomyces inhibens]